MQCNSDVGQTQQCENSALNFEQLDGHICEHIEKLELFLSQNSNKNNELVLIEHLMPKLLSVFGEKSKKMHYEKVFGLLKSIVHNVDSWFTPYIADKLSTLIKESMMLQKKYSYMLLVELIQKNPEQIKISMPVLIPLVSSDVNDVVASVKESDNNIGNIVKM